MDQKTLHDHLLSFPRTRLAFPFGEEVGVYQVFIPKTSIDNDVDASEETIDGEWKMFALIAENKDPLQISLKCDPQLAVLLREEYETVLGGYHLNKKHWNTILLTGQLPWVEIKGLIRHSYDLVTKAGTDTPQIPKY